MSCHRYLATDLTLQSQISSVIVRSLHDKVASKSCNVEVIRVWESPNLLNLLHLMIHQISSLNQSEESPLKRHIDQHSIKATVVWQLANVHSVHIHFSFYLFPLDQRTRSQIFISSFLFRFSFLPSHILTIISSLLHIHFRTLLMNMTLTKTPNLKSTKGFKRERVS